jgi:hypothetical protein
VFDALSLGADGVYFKKLVANSFRRPFEATDFPEVFAWYRPMLRTTRPRVQTAVYYPQDSFVEKAGRHRGFFDQCRRLRDLVDIDMLDDTLIADGALDHYEAFVVLPPARLTPASKASVDRWKTRQPARMICLPSDGSDDPITYVKGALAERVSGDWREDGVYCSWIESGVLVLNSRDKPAGLQLEGKYIDVPAHAMVRVIPD